MRLFWTFCSRFHCAPCCVLVVYLVVYVGESDSLMAHMAFVHFLAGGLVTRGHANPVFG